MSRRLKKIHQRRKRELKMNKYQGAFKNLNFEFKYNVYGETIQELVERATPKKVNKSEQLKDDVTIGCGTFKAGTSILTICPKCGKWTHKLWNKTIVVIVVKR